MRHVAVCTARILSCGTNYRLFAYTWCGADLICHVYERDHNSGDPAQTVVQKSRVVLVNVDKQINKHCVRMEEDWDIPCSDEEYSSIKGPWEPPPEVIERLYNILDKGELPELQWKCPGYRSPSPEAPEQPKEETQVKQVEDKSDFDFMDEMTSPKLKIRNKGEESLKGSAKKKTTSLDGVINNMRRHNLLPSAPSGR